jgi:BolA protein
MRVAENIRSKIERAFTPARLEVEDESHKHAGHAGAGDGKETHFRLTIVSATFDGMSRIERHRRVTAVLKEEIGNPVHALSLKAMTPAEAAREEES